MITGKAKKDYQREYMQKRRSNKVGLTGSNKPKPVIPVQIIIPVTPPVKPKEEPQYIESVVHRALASTVHKGTQVQGEESLTFRVLQSTIHKKEYK